MANKHPGLSKVGDFWHFSLKVNGERLHGSTKAKDLPTARRVLEGKRRQLLDGQCGKGLVPFLGEVLKAWLEVHRAIHSLKHCREVQSVTGNWILPAVGTRRVDKITTKDVQELRSRMLEAGRSPVTTNDALKILKLLLNFAVKRGHLKQIPAQFEFLRVQKRPRPTIPCANIRAFINAIDEEARNPHVRVIIRVMVGLGLRESEALGMRWEWFDMIQRTYVVGKSKGKEARVLPVPDWLWDSIFAMPKPLSEWVFPAEDGKPHRAQFCKKILQRVCKKLGLGNVTQHRLRATFATLHAESGTPITEIQGMLGHKNIQTTMIYVEQNMEAKRRAQDCLSQKLGLG